MTCTLQIDAVVLQHPIPYKYVIYSPKMEHEDDCYEYLHGYKSNPNRCLEINQPAHGGVCDSNFSLYIHLPAAMFMFFFTHATHLGTHHQYDTVVYPKDFKPSKPWYGKTKEKTKSFFGMDVSKEEDVKPLSTFEMGKLCLNTYLEGYRQKLCSGSFPQEANLLTLVQEICHIFKCLFHPLIFRKDFKPTECKLDRKFLEVC